MSGRVVGPPVPAGPAPWALAAADGSLLVLPAPGRYTGRLTHLSPAGRTWRAREVPVQAGSRALRLVGDGVRHAVLAYEPPAGGAAGVPGDRAPCRLALLDVPAGALLHTAAACAAGDTLTGLAVEATPGGAVAYVGLWRSDGGQGGSPGGRLLALRAATGAVLAATPLDGVPAGLTVAPAPGGGGRRLYAVEGTGGAERTDPANGADPLLAARWRVLGLRPATLEPETEHVLDWPPRALTVGEDGERAYAFAGVPRAGGPSALVALDLRTGRVRPLAAVPGSGSGGLAVAGGRLYAPDPEGQTVSVVDSRGGGVVQTVAVGRAPLAIVQGGAWLP